MLSTLDLKENDKVSVSIGDADISGLDEDIKSAIGDKPVIELNLLVNGQRVSWENANAPVTVSIPYSPTEEEMADPEHIVVWYIDSTGKPVSIPNGKYDPSTGMVTFRITHFSKYAVAFVKKSFNDIENYPWAKKAIEVMASKGIISGNMQGGYDPGKPITRADFIKLFMNTLELTAEVKSNFEDVKQTDYFYKEVGIAKQLGIASGTGNNMFKPNDLITRQDVAVLLEKALKIAKKPDFNNDKEQLQKFEDYSDISQYALDSVANVVSIGLMQGSGGYIKPKDNTTRAEAAVVFYKLYNIK